MTPWQTNSSGNFQLNGKMLDAETGNYYYGARYYNPKWSLWLSVDPLAENYPGWSPYNYTLYNPVKYTDPTGMAASPIYDKNGNFLGTDNQGLQGKAIVMDKSDFTQGMSHKTALKKDLGTEGLNGGFALLNLLLNYDNLPDRPDYDGFVTMSEGIKWAKAHPNVLRYNNPEDALYLDASKLNFGSLSTNNFPLPECKQGNVNLLDYVNLFSSSSRSTVYALGNTQIKLLDNETGAVKLYWDTYNWDYHSSSKSSTRENLIYLERMRINVDDSNGFKIYIYGTGKIKIDE